MVRHWRAARSTAKHSVVRMVGRHAVMAWWVASHGEAACSLLVVQISVLLVRLRVERVDHWILSSESGVVSRARPAHHHVALRVLRHAAELACDLLGREVCHPVAIRSSLSHLLLHCCGVK